MPYPTYDKFNEINQKITIYGSDSVVKSVRKLFFRKGKNISEEEIKKLLGNIFLQIRRDMGNKKTKLTPKELGEQYSMYMQLNEVEIENAKKTQNKTQYP